MVSIKQLRTLEELAVVLEKAVDARSQFTKRFSEEKDRVEIMVSILKPFGKDSLCYGELYPDGELKFFSLIELSADKTQAYWHFLFSHSRFRYKTKEVIEEIKKELKDIGIRQINMKTVRTTSSYKRWLKSLSFFPTEITYSCKLWET